MIEYNKKLTFEKECKYSLIVSVESYRFFNRHGRSNCVYVTYGDYKKSIVDVMYHESSCFGECMIKEIFEVKSLTPFVANAATIASEAIKARCFFMK